MQEFVCPLFVSVECLEVSICFSQVIILCYIRTAFLLILLCDDKKKILILKMSHSKLILRTKKSFQFISIRIVSRCKIRSLISAIMQCATTKKPKPHETCCSFCNNITQGQVLKAPRIILSLEQHRIFTPCTESGISLSKV